jgi:hypothetical protein
MRKLLNVEGTLPLAVCADEAKAMFRMMAAGAMTAWGSGIMNAWSMMNSQQLYPSTRRSCSPRGSEGLHHGQLLAREIQPFQH